MEAHIPQKIEAFLFYKSEPVTETELAKHLHISVADVSNALDTLEHHLTDRGVCLVRSNGAVEMTTAPLAADLITELRAREVSGDLGKAALETLAIVLYTGPVSRAHIDYIRGVNSTFILRRLLIRGLITRTSAAGQGQTTQYEATTDVLKHLGIQRVSDLPEYGDMKTKLDQFTETHENQTDHAVS